MPIDNVPQFIRDNAQKGLDYLSEGFGGDGLTEGTKSAAREMSNGNISDNKVRKMAPWFARHKVDGQAPKNSDSSDPGYPGPGLVAWLLWGGNANFDDAAQDWAQRQINRLDNETNKARSKMKKTERRTFTVRNIETREAEDGTMRMAGYAAVFNEPSLPLPFIERIAPGAFSKTLKETPDVRLLANHEGLPMARTKNGTMRLYEDETGLYFEAELANTQEARDLYTLVARGDVDQMSFAFRVIRQKYNEDRSERLLTEVSLADGDVSIVTYPAYPTTSVEAREALKKAMAEIKEGREVTGESLVVLQQVFGDLSEGHEYIMRAVEVMSMLFGDEDIEEDSMSPLEQVEEDEIQMIEVMEATNPLERHSITTQVFDIVMSFLIWVGECARLVLACFGFIALLKRFVWRPATMPATRSVATQSQCTYTSTRGVQEPRFLLLEPKRQGVFLD